MHTKILTILGIAASAGLHAAVVTSSVPDLAIPITFDGVYFNFDDINDPNSFNPTSTEPADWDINLFFGGAAIGTSDTLQPVTASATTNAAVLGLGSGAVVDGSVIFPSSYSGSLDHIGGGLQQWSNSDTKFIGFRLQPESFPDDVNRPSGPIYGWMKVTLQNDGAPGNIEQWAWDTTGAAIAIPEPGTMTLTALALGGLAMRRRRNARS